MIDPGPLLLSFEVATLATLLCALAGVGLAAILADPRVPARDTIELVSTLPLVLPPTVLGYWVLVVLGRRSALGSLWESVFGSPIVFTRTGAILAASIGCFPLVLRSARAALEAVDPVLVDAARVHGAGPWRALVAIRIPLARAGIVSGIVLGFARALGDFGVTLMVAGNIPGRTRTAPLAIFHDLQAGRDADAAGLAAVLTALALVILWFVQRLGRRPAP